MNLCHVKGVEKYQYSSVKFELNDLEKAIRLYLKDASDSLKMKFDTLTRLQDDQKMSVDRRIWEIMINSNKDEVSLDEIALALKGDYSKVNKKSLRKSLIRFTTEENGEILRYDDASNKYSVNDPFFVTYYRLKNRNKSGFGI